MAYHRPVEKDTVQKACKSFASSPQKLFLDAKLAELGCHEPALTRYQRDDVDKDVQAYFASKYRLPVSDRKIPQYVIDFALPHTVIRLKPRLKTDVRDYRPAPAFAYR